MPFFKGLFLFLRSFFMKHTTKTIKITSIAAALILASTSTITAFAADDEKMSVHLRIEGINISHLNQSYEVDKNSTVAELIQLADKLSDELTVEGVDSGYITEVNGDPVGCYSGWDGWNYIVNNNVPNVGICDYTLSDNDSVVLFFSDYPAYIPQINTANLTSKGEISFTAEKTDYDQTDFTPITTIIPLDDMKVYFGEKEYITDADGKITISAEDYSVGKHSLQINKRSYKGAPCVLRYADDFYVEIFDTPFGDINADLITDVKDVTSLQLNLVGSYDVIAPRKYILDVNGDNVCDVKDVTELQLYLVNNKG